jgi:hypothetical protein
MSTDLPTNLALDRFDGNLAAAVVEKLNAASQSASE